MRENNFCLPNLNKASVGITPALYDRRALDCTSTLPLINSLNNLAYLTTSSARIRDILTVDGGVERLVCILKEGRSKDTMDMWKWNLAFQCVVNVGVRGSETVRTRVVEADMVPVVATILDNYIRAIEKCREKEISQTGSRARTSSLTRRSHSRPNTRRQQPPPIEIPQTPAPQVQEHRRQLSTPQNEPVFTSSPFGNNISGFGIRTVQEVDRLPSMLPTLNNIDLSSQPVSPSTPSASRTQGSVLRRPSIRHQLSVSGPWVDDQADDSLPETSDNNTVSPAPLVGVQADIAMQDVEEVIARGGSATPVTLTVPTVSVVDEFSTHAEESTTTPQPQQGFDPVQPLPAVNVVNVAPPSVRQTLDSYYGRLPALPNLLSALPRDEDVIMSLQLLAYVSKYCNLRSYFQATQLVPRLKVGPELEALDSAGPSAGRTPEQLEEDWDNEYVDVPGAEPYNIFPLIEKFTVRNASSCRHALHPTSPQQSESMQYWAGVVMRNLCRKDESRGGIRQCAYWKCGKWEQWPRQFAKCRRCRRTKYCSKDCQKGAWSTHRFWCVAAEEAREGDAPSARQHHHHHHHHHRRREGETRS